MEENKLTFNEESELESLTDYKLSKTRFMLQAEHDRYKELMDKKFGSMALTFEFMQLFSKNI